MSSLTKRNGAETTSCCGTTPRQHREGRRSGAEIASLMTTTPRVHCKGRHLRMVYNGARSSRPFARRFFAGHRWSTFLDAVGRKWDVRASKALQLKAAHLLRDSWRVLQMKEWLSSDRKDSAIARSQHLQIRYLSLPASWKWLDSRTVMVVQSWWVEHLWRPRGRQRGPAETSVTRAAERSLRLWPASSGTVQPLVPFV